MSFIIVCTMSHEGVETRQYLSGYRQAFGAPPPPPREFIWTLNPWGSIVYSSRAEAESIAAACPVRTVGDTTLTYSVEVQP